VDGLWKSLLKALGSDVLNGLRNLRGTSGVRLALGAGVVSLKLLEQRLEIGLDSGCSQRWGERSQPPWVRSAGSS